MDVYPDLKAVLIQQRTNYFINIADLCMVLNSGTKLVQQLKTYKHKGESLTDKYFHYFTIHIVTYCQL